MEENTVRFPILLDDSKRLNESPCGQAAAFRAGQDIEPQTHSAILYISEDEDLV